MYSSLIPLFITQGSVGSCNCGYIMFSKRSGPSPRHLIDKTEDDTDMIKLQADHLMTELLTEEILKALDILERVNNSNKLSDKLSNKEVSKGWLIEIYSRFV